jgi:hypothetical protein
LYEESSKINNQSVDKRITNIEKETSIIGTKPGYDYSKLDKYGLIQENTPVNDKTVLIGMASNIMDRPGVKMDISKTPKKGQLGVVDKTFITEGEEGERIAKVRIREVRIPTLGDKMASRVGQKGTVGLIIPECDMPFTKEGLRPDIIINPHAIPSRMTIGQLVESIVGKVCIAYGGFGDCTPFTNDGSKIGVIGEHLVRAGFHSSGNEVMYNGMTGEQIESSIFIGPTYYMRLKQMVKDKINYRALGPRTALTRQPLSGRANDGGLRIGEMERDVLISHGMNDFLRESMMDRGDKYYLAICNTTGMIAVYNPSKNLFMSPGADGPIQFIGSIDGKEMHIQNMTKYGRSFSIVCVPYTFKLLIQELQTVNMQMRIITEDNISQIENMTFSKNIEKLMHLPDATPRVVIEETIKRLEKTGTEDGRVEKGLKQRMNETMETPDFPTEEEIQYKDYEERPPVIQHVEGDSYPDSPEELPPGGFDAYPPPRELNSRDYRGGQNMDQDKMMGKIEIEGGKKHSMRQHSHSHPHPQPHPHLENEFQIGESVFYRGDIKPNRLWIVIDHGRDFYTIDTEDMEGLQDVQDMRKIVSPIDIYRPNEVVYGSPWNPMSTESSQSLSPSTMYPGLAGMPGPGGIQVNPVIKIVNGSDHSMGHFPGEMEKTENPIQLPNEKRIATEVENTNRGGDGNEIDFSKKFYIKKV